MLPDLNYRYVIIYNEQGAGVAVAYFQMLHFQKQHYNYPLFTIKILRWLEDAIMKKGFAILSCGNMLRVDSPGIYFNEAATTSSYVFDLLKPFFLNLQPLSHAILVKDWNKPNDKGWVKKLGFQVWPDDLTMKITLKPEWENFDGYVKALRHRYGQRARNTRKKLHGVIRRELLLDEIEPLSPQFDKLYQNIVSRQSIRLIIINGAYFTEMKREYAENFRVFGYFKEEELIAFSSNVLYFDLWELHYIGMDYTANEEHQLYFNIMFDAISDGILAGKRELELGRTAREAKAVIGGYPVYFKNYIFIRGVVPRLIVKMLRQLFLKNAGLKWELRNPFRE